MVEGTVLDEFGVDTAVDAAVDVSARVVSGARDGNGPGWRAAHSNMMPYWAQMSVICQERSEAVHTWYGLVALPLLPDTVMSTALQRLASRGSTREAFIVGHENESTRIKTSLAGHVCRL